MKLVYDNAIGLRVPAGVEAVALPTGELTADAVRDCDILAVRSATRVDAALLGGSRVRLLASATAGLDHIDLGWLRGRGIGLVSAQGANARSVAEYALVCVVLLARCHKLDLGGIRVAIVGFGNIGMRLHRLLRGLGVAVLVCDPFRQCGRSPAELSACAPGGSCWAGLDDALDSDIVSVHVPLSDDGAHPTRHLLGGENLQRLRAGACLINTSRGGVHCTADLIDWAEHYPGRLCLDVYENEPSIDEALVKQALVATPHIAGYTLEARARIGACLSAGIERWLERGGGGDAQLCTAVPSAIEQQRMDCLAHPGDAGCLQPGAGLLDALLQCTDPRGDGQGFLDYIGGLAPARRRQGFIEWRRGYLSTSQPRREFAAWRCRDDDNAPLLTQLGFTPDRAVGG